jgi:hypothetical protein
MPSGGSSLDDNLRSGQAQQVATMGGDTASNPTTNGSSNTAKNDYSEDDEDEVADEVDNAIEEIDTAEKIELAKGQTALGSAILTAGDYVRGGLNKWFGTVSGVTEEEIEEMVKEVEDRLTVETTQVLVEEAETYAQDAENKVAELAEDEQDAGLALEDIRGDVIQSENEAISNVKARIEARAEDMRKHMREKAQQVEMEMLEKRLSEKLGKTVKLVVIDDEIAGVDELLDGLTMLGGNDNPGDSTGGVDGNDNASPPPPVGPNTDDLVAEGGKANDNEDGWG